MSFQPTFQPTAQPRGFDFLKDVDVRLSVELGRANLTLREVLALGEESVVMLDRLTDELLDVMVNGKIIAKGEIVAQDNRFGLRIVELAGGEASSSPTPSAAFDGSFDTGGMTDKFDNTKAPTPDAGPAAGDTTFDEAELDRAARGKR